MRDRQLWVLAGGNGAGKSTFYRVALAPRGIKLVNADHIARLIDPGHPEAVGYQAAAIAEEIRTALLRLGTSFCYETVFSHPSKIDFVAEARAAGYQVILLYFHLETPELNQARVRQRVSEGGQDVPPYKIRSRIPRTMRNVATALPLVDEARLLDNSLRDEPYRQVAVLRKGAWVRLADPLPEWARQLIAATGVRK